MRIILYSNHCPCCEILKSQLDAAGVAYRVITDIDQMLAMGLTHLPMLSVDGMMMNYPAALAWLKERMNTHADRQVQGSSETPGVH